MRLERQHCRAKPAHVSLAPQTRKQGLVAEMHAIEIADSQCAAVGMRQASAGESELAKSHLMKEAVVWPRWLSKLHAIAKQALEATRGVEHVE
jgi:hypothetical protein